MQGKGPVTGDAISGVLAGLSAETKGHQLKAFKQPLDAKAFARGRKMDEYSAAALARNPAEKLRLAA